MIALSAGIVLSAAAGHAADLAPAMAPMPEPVQTPEGWKFSFAPYFWASGLSGKSANFGLPTIDVHESFGDILSDLDFAFMAAGDARYGPYSIMTDLSYARVTTDAGTPRGVVASRVGLKTETFTAFLGGGYSILDDGVGRLDVVGGARIWYVDTKVSFQGGLLGGVSRADSATWVDGMVGLRGMYSITPNFYLTGWGMIGTGGADIDWDVMGGLGYKFNEKVSAIAGYRALGVDYHNESLTYDMIQHGPMLGVVLRF
ncbi:MAG: hypothetical protein KGI75_01270 [Rhizobiaceae bacterium]|nr:hypothetical protein [Rhizobiaceae bacterium]